MQYRFQFGSSFAETRAVQFRLQIKLLANIPSCCLALQHYMKGMESEKESPAPFVSPLRCQAHQMRVRTRLLHTCILYLSIIGCKIYKKLASQPGLLGFLARTFPLPLAFPVLRAIKCCILAMASFADDQLLACENRIQQLLPPSSHLFDMLEWMVQYMIDTLPAKFDEATHVAELLIEWFSREERTSCVPEEKEIVVDSNSTQSGLGACRSLVNDKEEATVDEKLCNGLHQCEEYEPTDKEKLIESFSSEKRTSRLAGEKKIVMDSNCAQSGLNACSSLVNDQEEKAMVDEELYNSLDPCNQDYEPADKIKRLDALEEEKKAAGRKGGKKKLHAKIVELEVPHNEMKDGKKHWISDGVREGKESVEGLAKSEYKKEGSATCEYKKVDEGARILHLFEQGWIMQYCL